MPIGRKIAVFATALALPGSLALAKGPPSPASGRPELLSRLVECRAIADSAQRLACYDAQVSAIDTAEKKQDLVVMDRAQVRETRKSLFGFSLPSFTLGGQKLNEADDVQEINSTIAALRKTPSGWTLILADGAGTWQSDDLTSPPSVGDKVRIRKASMGSYLGTIGFSRGARLRRLN